MYRCAIAAGLISSPRSLLLNEKGTISAQMLFPTSSMASLLIFPSGVIEIQISHMIIRQPTYMYISHW